MHKLQLIYNKPIQKSVAEAIERVSLEAGRRFNRTKEALVQQVSALENQHKMKAELAAGGEAAGNAFIVL